MTSENPTGTRNRDRLLIPDVVKGWPQVTITDCTSYRPTHPLELVTTTTLDIDCIEAAFRSTSAVFFSSWDPSPLSDSDRSLYDVWGEINGHQILVRARGDEHISGYRTRDARVKTTGEIATLAVGRAPEGSFNEAEVWPYGQ